MSEQLKEFQINGYTEHEIEAFLDATEAQYRYIEDWSGAYVKPGMDVIGWGTTAISTKRLNKLADLMGVALVSINLVVSF